MLVREYKKDYPAKMRNEEYKICACSKEDAEHIGRAVMNALHYEYDINEPWCRIFTILAARDDSQYSYRNAYKAITRNGEIAGIVIAYPGGNLKELRKAFIQEVVKELGEINFKITDETEPGEWYIDSLTVYPEYRRHGIGRKLLETAIQAAPQGMTPGLLCTHSNTEAAKLYESRGFKLSGERAFMGEFMHHYILRK